MFEHVTHNTTHRLLVDGWDGYEDAIIDALGFTDATQVNDVRTQMLDQRIIDARAEALLNAERTWDDGDGEAALFYLRQYWRI
jgi:hypothetical protein